jgi:PAS domain S-box-containing protein
MEKEDQLNQEHNIDEVLNIIKNIEDERQKLNAILSSMREGLIVVDVDKKIIMMNQMAGILLRMAPGEALGKDIDEVLSLFNQKEEKTSKQELPLKKAMDEKNIININLLQDIYAQNREGKMFPVAMQITPLLKIKQSEASGALILLRDISIEKEVDQAKTEFVSLASHQLRTPLSTIKWIFVAPSIGRM